MPVKNDHATKKQKTKQNKNTKQNKTKQNKTKTNTQKKQTNKQTTLVGIVEFAYPLQVLITWEFQICNYGFPHSNFVLLFKQMYLFYSDFTFVHKEN